MAIDGGSVCLSVGLEDLTDDVAATIGVVDESAGSLATAISDGNKDK